MDACICDLPAFRRGDPSKGKPEEFTLDKARIAHHNGPLWCATCFKWVPSSYFQGPGAARAALASLRPTRPPEMLRQHFMAYHRANG